MTRYKWTTPKPPTNAEIALEWMGDLTPEELRHVVLAASLAINTPAQETSLGNALTNQAWHRDRGDLAHEFRKAEQ